MKKGLFFATVAAMILPSCVQDESLVDDTSSAPKEITFQTVVAKQSSRALVDGPAYKATDPEFGTWARLNPNKGGTTPGYQGYISNERIIHKTEAGVSYWGVSDNNPYFWPEQGSLTFYSYSPFYFQEPFGEDEEPKPVVESSDDSAPKIDIRGISFPNYDVDAHQLTDLMVADVQVGLTANITANETGNPSYYTGVPTVFNHVLAKLVSFELSTSDDYDGDYTGTIESADEGDRVFRIRKISLKNILHKGTYFGVGVEDDGTTIPGKWTPTADVKNEYVWFDCNKLPETMDDGTTENPEHVYGVEFGHTDTKHLKLKAINTESTYEKNPTIDNGYLLLMPQSFENQVLEVVYSVSTYGTPEGEKTPKWMNSDVQITRSVKLSDIHPAGEKFWAENSSITYHLYFSTTEIRWAPHVTNWEDKKYEIEF